MRQSKGVKTYKQTQRKQSFIGKSVGKQRKQIKHLYTLNKQQQQQDDDGSLDERLQYLTKLDRKQQQHKQQQQYQSQQQSQGNEYQQQRIDDDNDSYSQQQEYIDQNITLDDRLRNTNSQNVSISSNNNHSIQQLNILNNNNQDRILRYNNNNNVPISNGYQKKKQRQQKNLQLRSKSDHKMLQLHMLVKQLQQQNTLLTNSLSTHEQRQTQMVTKYAKLQAQNKRLSYEISKINKTNYQQNKQLQQINKLKLSIQTTTKTNKQLLIQIDKQNVRIVTYLKTLINKILQPKGLVVKSQNNQNNSNNNNYANKEAQSITSYLQKCIATLKQNRKNIHKKFIINQQDSKSNTLNIDNNNQQKISNQQFTIPSYETQRLPQLLSQNTNLKQQLNKIKQQFQKLSQTYKKTTTQKQNQFKNQQKLLCEKYNSALEQIKNKYKALQIKIHQQQDNNELRVNELEKTIGQKQRVIKKLKDQLRQANIKLDQIEEERFSLIRNTVDNNHNTNNKRRQSFKKFTTNKKFIDGDYLNDTLLSNKERSQSLSQYSQKIIPNHLHQQSFCQYKPQRKRKRNLQNERFQSSQIDKVNMIKKSQKNKNYIKNDIQMSRQQEEKDLQNLNQEIEQLERQILEEFQYHV